MSNSKRVAAGRLGIGVPRVFTAEEIAKRSERIRAVQHLAVLARAKKRREKLEKIEAQKALVEAAAVGGVFVPVADLK